MLKSSYNLEFLGLAQAVKERDLEDRLISRLQQFILELGYGFCFVGRQYRLALGRKEYFVDLLFYHRFLKALVAFDLKVGPFAPEHAGKMDFYLNLLNEKERAPDDHPSIGIILCEVSPARIESDRLTGQYLLEFFQFRESPRFCLCYSGSGSDQSSGHLRKKKLCHNQPHFGRPSGRPASKASAFALP